MRVLTVGTLYPPHDLGGGYELQWQAAVDGLRARGHDVRVLATDHSVSGAGPDGPDVYRELRWYWRDHAFPRRSLRESVAIERHNAATLRRHVREFSPDRIAWFPMGGLSLGLLETARRLGVPSVAFVGDDWLDYGQRADGWLRRFTGRPRLARAAERLIGVPARVPWAEVAHYAFVSAATRDRAWWAGVPVPRNSIVRAGVDTRFVEAPPRDWDGSLLYAGRIDPRKGIDTAVEALAQLPAATLTIAGTGADADVAALRARIEALGVTDRVRLLGALPPSQLPALYADHDAVVFPVLWEEPWGLVPLEAMATGRPVVATGRGGSAEYLEDEVNTLLFAAGDATALATQLRRLAEDGRLRARLRAGGLVTASRHTNAAVDDDVERTLAAAGGAREAPAASADVVLFLSKDVEAGPGLEAAHTELHRRLPGDDWAVLGAVDLPRDAFTRWLAGRGHPPLGPPAPGEVGPVRLDLTHASISRSLLERAGGVGDGGLELARRLSDAGMRLHFAPELRARRRRPVTLAEAHACLQRALAAEPRLSDRLRERVARARAAGPARGRLGRALVAYVPESFPWLGPRVWRNATDHYERRLATYDRSS